MYGRQQQYVRMKTRKKICTAFTTVISQMRETQQSCSSIVVGDNLTVVASAQNRLVLDLDPPAQACSCDSAELA